MVQCELGRSMYHTVDIVTQVFDPTPVRNLPGSDTRLRHMTRVIMEAFAALSPEQVQAVKDHEKAPGHMGQLRAVLKHRQGAAEQCLVDHVSIGRFHLQVSISV